MRRLLPLLLLAACTPRPTAPDALPAEALAAIDTLTLAQHVNVLADDSLLGRGPGTLGEERTVAYLQREFAALGLTPGNPDGSWTQPVPLVGITVMNAPTLTVGGGTAPLALRWRDDVVAWTKHVAPAVTLDASELVFVGYGVEAPEFGWDDFKGVDVKGKTLVMLINDPPLADTTKFRGAAMTYYGRWTYKYEQAQKHGAAGALIIHETGPAGYPFEVVQGKTAEQFDLVTPDSNRTRALVEGWLSKDAATRLFAEAGLDLAELQAKARTAEFTPVSLGRTASMTLQNSLRRVDSRNVAALLPGSDPVLKDEVVIYTSHWDHFGVGTPVAGDSIYNGALDNATGTAGLLVLAKAYTALPTPPKRSILFLAVTAEEQGLLGSSYYAVAPLYPLAKTAAVLNMDGLSVVGAARDLTVTGLGASELDDYAQAAAATQNRRLTPDPSPEKGYYYRSDHFPFAKQGVPAFYAGGGDDIVGRGADFAKQAEERYVAEDYHKPSDEVKPDWTYVGAVDDLRLFLTIGARVANAATFPQWRPGNEFRAAREAMLGGGAK